MAGFSTTRLHNSSKFELLPTPFLDPLPDLPISTGKSANMYQQNTANLQ
jgi:hypothetical protein